MQQHINNALRDTWEDLKATSLQESLLTKSSVVCLPVRVYSHTLSGTHRCPPRTTSTGTSILSVPEPLSIHGLVFANLKLHHLQSQLTPRLCSPKWDRTHLVLFIHMFPVSMLKKKLARMLKWLTGCPGYTACINSCGFYKQLTWLLSKSPLNSPPSLHLFSLRLSLCLIWSFILFAGCPRLDLKIRYAKWKQKGGHLVFFQWIFGLAFCCLKARNAGFWAHWYWLKLLPLSSLITGRPHHRSAGLHTKSRAVPQEAVRLASSDW